MRNVINHDSTEKTAEYHVTITDKYWDWGIRFYALGFGIIIFLIDIIYLNLDYSEEILYIEYAQRIGSGEGYRYLFNPIGFSFIIWLAQLGFQNYFIASKFVNAAFHVCFILANYIFWREFLPKPRNRSIAGISILLWTWIPELLIISQWSTIDVPFGTFFICMIYCFMQDFVHKRKYLYLGAVFGALTFLFRWTGLFFLPFELILLFFRYKQIYLGKSVKIITDSSPIDLIVRFLLLYFFLSSPWLIYNYMIWGDPFANNAILNIASNGREITSVAISSGYNYNVIAYLIDNWAYFLTKFFLNLVNIPYNFFVQTLYPMDFMELLWLKVPLAIGFYGALGWIMIKLKAKLSLDQYLVSESSRFDKIFSYILASGKSLLVFGFIMLYCIQVSIGWILFRFLIPIFPGIITLFLYGIVEIVEIVKKSLGLTQIKDDRNSKTLNMRCKIISQSFLRHITTIGLIVLVGFASFGITNYISNLREVPDEYIIGGNYLKKYCDSSLPILAYRSQYYAFYSGFSFRHLPSTINEWSSYLDIGEPKYFIVAEALDLDTHPELAVFFDIDSVLVANSFLKLIYYTNVTGNRLVIYYVGIY